MLFWGEAGSYFYVWKLLEALLPCLYVEVIVLLKHASFLYCAKIIFFWNNLVLHAVSFLVSWDSKVVVFENIDQEEAKMVSCQWENQKSFCKLFSHLTKTSFSSGLFITDLFKFSPSGL